MAGQEGWDWKRIGEEVQARRGEVGYKRREDLLAEHPDVRQTFLAEIEQGKPGQRRGANLAALAVALRWPRDAFSRLGRGESLEDAEVLVRLDAMEEAIATMAAQVRQLAEFVGLGSAPSGPREQRDSQ